MHTYMYMYMYMYINDWNVKPAVPDAVTCTKFTCKVYM